MHRPIYETESNRQAQARTAKEIEEHFKCTMISTPRMYSLDYMALRDGHPVAWVEIKERKYTLDAIKKLGGYLLSLHKLTSARALHQITMLPFILVVKLQDGTYYKSFTSDLDFIKNKISVGGRLDRGDLQDIEPCVLIDTDSFVLIERSKHD